jgi:hypothetical protein
MIGIHSHLRWQVKGYREAGLSVGEKVFEPAIGFSGGSVSGVLPHRPKLASVSGGLNAAGERVFAGTIRHGSHGKLG